MTRDPSLDDFLARLNAGEPEAVTRFREFVVRLLATIRRRLDRRLACRVDPEDVLQSALRSFFRRQKQTPQAVENWEELLAVVLVIAQRKCMRQQEHNFAGRRDIRREHGASGRTSAQGEALSREPSPIDAAIVNDISDRLFDGLSEREREVLVLSINGHSVAEVSRKLRRTERTVRRLLTSVRRRLERELE
jgi:RNA polymerase sigma-70 factor, ECF subfamily